MSARVRAWAVPALALLGLGDAGYLSVIHLRDEIPACGGYAGCAEVNSSPYAEIFGVPIAYLGFALFATFLGIGLLRMRLVGPAWGWATLGLYGLALAGAVFMAYLTAVEFLVLHAVCYWCLGIAVITLLLLALTTREVWAIGAYGVSQHAQRP